MRFPRITRRRRPTPGPRSALFPPGAFLLLLLAPALALAQTPTAAPRVSRKPIIQEIFQGGEPESVEDLRDMQARVRDLVREVLPCTVAVRVGSAQGSGVIISPDGFVLTAAHVAGQPNQDATFVLSDGRRVRGKTLGRNIGIDAGLVKITDSPGAQTNWPFAEMGESADVKPGQWCLAVGHPGGYQRGRAPVVRLGRVLSKTGSAIMTDCTLVGGDSGGPLFDIDGDVIGVHSRIGTSLTTNLHVPVSIYRESWDRLASGQSWGGSPFIGVEGEPKSPRANIVKVYPGGAAERGGMKPGDVITQFDNKRVTSFGSLAALVGRKQPGDKVTVVVQRGERAVELQLVIGQREG